LEECSGQLLMRVRLQVRKLESQGVPTKQVEAITSAITEVLNDSLESISESFVSKAEMQKVKRFDIARRISSWLVNFLPHLLVLLGFLQSEMLQESNISKFKSQV